MPFKMEGYEGDTHEWLILHQTLPRKNTTKLVGMTD